MKTFVIAGSHFSDIAGFYVEINRLFMAGEDWQLGESLDAFNDLLYGGFGTAANLQEWNLEWRNFEKSRVDLGVEATRQHYFRKLQQPGLYNAETARKKLRELDAGSGKTYFEMLLEIISEHPNITLVPED